MAMEEPKPRKWSTALIILVAIAIVLAGALGWALYALYAAPAAPQQINYPIGLAIATTGPTYQVDGPIRRDAALLAIEQMNAQLAAAGSPVRFQPIHEDTTGTADGAREALQLLAAAGVKVVVGPLSTGEVSAIRDFVTQNKIVSISPSSTGIAAAIPNDYVFRAPPTDIPQSKALAQLVDTLGYTEVAIIARNDDYGKGFADLFESTFETEYGGQVTRIAYDPTVQDLAAEVTQLAADVQGLGPGADTAVLMVAFEGDGLEILDEARLSTVLRGVRWFGSESTRRSAFLNETKIPDIVQFLLDTQFTGFFATPSLNPVSVAFEAAYVAKYPGRNPKASPYSYYSYDSAWMAMQAVLLAGKYDGEAIAKMLPVFAATYLGASGHKAMDANGDAISADYTAWRVARDASNKPYYEEFARWIFATEDIEFFA